MANIIVDSTRRGSNSAITKTNEKQNVSSSNPFRRSSTQSEFSKLVAERRKSQKINEKASVISGVQSLRQGKLPTNDHLNRVINRLVDSRSIANNQSYMSRDGQLLLKDFKELLLVFQRALKTKNRDELFQSMIYHVKRSEEAYRRDQHSESDMQEAKKDAQSGAGAILKIAKLFLFNPEFRSLLEQILAIAQQSMGIALQEGGKTMNRNAKDADSKGKSKPSTEEENLMNEDIKDSHFISSDGNIRPITLASFGNPSATLDNSKNDNNYTPNSLHDGPLPQEHHNFLVNRFAEYEPQLAPTDDAGHTIDDDLDHGAVQHTEGNFITAKQLLRQQSRPNKKEQTFLSNRSSIQPTAQKPDSELRDSMEAAALQSTSVLANPSSIQPTAQVSDNDLHEGMKGAAQRASNRYGVVNASPAVQVPDSHLKAALAVTRTDRGYVTNLHHQRSDSDLRASLAFSRGIHDQGKVPAKTLDVKKQQKSMNTRLGDIKREQIDADNPIIGNDSSVMGRQKDGIHNNEQHISSTDVPSSFSPTTTEELNQDQYDDVFSTMRHDDISSLDPTEEKNVVSTATDTSETTAVTEKVVLAPKTSIGVGAGYDLKPHSVPSSEIINGLRKREGDAILSGNSRRVNEGMDHRSSFEKRSKTTTTLGNSLGLHHANKKSDDIADGYPGTHVADRLDTTTASGGALTYGNNKCGTEWKQGDSQRRVIDQIRAATAETPESDAMTAVFDDTSVTHHNSTFGEGTTLSENSLGLIDNKDKHDSGDEQLNLVNAEHQVASSRSDENASNVEQARSVLQRHGEKSNSSYGEIGANSEKKKNQSPTSKGDNKIKSDETPNESLNEDSSSIDELVSRLKEIVTSIQKKPEYQEAISTLFNLFGVWGKKMRTGDGGMDRRRSSAVSIPEQAEYYRNVATFEAKTIIEDWAQGKSLDPILQQLSRLSNKLKQDESLKQLSGKVTVYIKRLLSEPEYLSNEKSTRDGDNLLKEIRSSAIEEYKPQVQELIEQSRDVIQTISNDDTAKEISGKLKDIHSHLWFDSNGNPSFKPQLVNDMRITLLPALIEQISYIPLPQIIYADKQYDIALENLVFEGDTIMPDIFEIRGDDFIRFSSKMRQEFTNSQSVNIHMSGIHATMKDVIFYFKKKSGFPRMSDAGVLSLTTGGAGLRISLRITSSSLDQYHTFKVDQCHSHIDKLDIKVRSCKHNLLYKVFNPVLTGIIRRQMAKAIEKKIVALIEGGDEKLTKQLRLKQSSNENGSISVGRPGLFSHLLSILNEKVVSTV